MKMPAWIVQTLLAALASLPPGTNQGPDATEMARLRARVQEHAKQANVDQREVVDDVFALANACTKEGSIDEAISLYQQGLRVDPWRLDYQLELARLLQGVGRRDEAVRKAQTVCEYAEQEGLIVSACEFLAEWNACPREPSDRGSSRRIANMEIVMIPIGDVNMRLLCELRDALQQKLGIRFSIARYSMMPGSVDRGRLDEFLEQAVEGVKDRMPRHTWGSFLKRLGLTEEALAEPNTAVGFLKAVFRESGFSQSDMDEFREAIVRLARMTQYDADRLLTTLARTRAPSRRNGAVGYLGITELDIFAKDYNFLFGWGRRGHALMSYHRYTAAFNEERPNRPRLLDRSIKQGISSTFFILGIPRCTSPTCARAYPHTLSEHDQKTCDLCEECRKALARSKAEYKTTARR